MRQPYGTAVGSGVAGTASVPPLTPSPAQWATRLAGPWRRAAGNGHHHATRRRGMCDCRSHTADSHGRAVLDDLKGGKGGGKVGNGATDGEGEGEGGGRRVWPLMTRPPPRPPPLSMTAHAAAHPSCSSWVRFSNTSLPAHTPSPRPARRLSHPRRTPQGRYPPATSLASVHGPAPCQVRCRLGDGVPKTVPSEGVGVHREDDAKPPDSPVRTESPETVAEASLLSSPSEAVGTGLAS